MHLSDIIKIYFKFREDWSSWFGGDTEIAITNCVELGDRRATLRSIQLYLILSWTNNIIISIYICYMKIYKLMICMVSDGHASSAWWADAQETACTTGAIFGHRYSRIRWWKSAKVFQHRRVPFHVGFELGKSRVVGSHELATDDCRRRRQRKQMTWQTILLI